MLWTPALSYHLINQPSWAARTCLRGLHFPYHSIQRSAEMIMGCMKTTTQLIIKSVYPKCDWKADTDIWHLNLQSHIMLYNVMLKYNCNQDFLWHFVIEISPFVIRHPVEQKCETCLDQRPLFIERSIIYEAFTTKSMKCELTARDHLVSQRKSHTVTD